MKYIILYDIYNGDLQGNAKRYNLQRIEGGNAMTKIEVLYPETCNLFEICSI